MKVSKEVLARCRQLSFFIHRARRTLVVVVAVCVRAYREGEGMGGKEVVTIKK